MKIFLDDIRFPPDNSWTIVRNYNEFVETISYFIENNINIDVISFDNDLGEELEGYDCAKWLVENNIVIPEIRIHSKNTVAVENIYYLMKNWQKFNNIKENIKIIK